MKALYKKLATGIALVLSLQIQAQNEGSAFTLTGMGVSTPFARDYQALGINPGNLDLAPKYEKTVTFGLAETALSLYSSVLTKTEVRQNVFRQNIKDLSQDEQKEYALLFANSDNAVDIDAMLFGISVRTKKLGTFAFSVRDRVDFYSSMGSQISQLLWLGYTAPYFDSLIVKAQNGGFDTIPNVGDIDPETLSKVVQGITLLQNSQSLSQLISGTKFGFTWYREFNLGWGKKIYSTENLEIHGGGAVKFLVGQGMMEVNALGSNAQAYSALSPLFDIDYTKISGNNPSALPPNAPPMQAVGKGFGFDLGATVVYRQKFLLSAAVTDIGSITWDGNLYQLRDIQLTEFTNPGLESVDFVEQVKQLNGSDGLLEWKGQQSRTTKLPSTMRVGFGYDNNGKFKVGADLVAPLNDDVTSLKKGVISVGGEFSPIPWLHLQAGFSQGGNYGTKIPVGIYFTLGQGTYELGVASRDLITFFKDNSPTISMASGFLRFRF